MKRRNFLKSMAAVGASAVLPNTWPTAFNLSTMYQAADAAIDYAGAQIAAPTIMPQVINIYLYGGPSELSGNLTNIVDIDSSSQNSYANAFGSGLLRFQNDPSGGLITPNGFWSGAGGDDMQFLLDGNHMSVYRTLMKRKDGTRSHRESILMSQKGSLDIENSAGVGTRVAAMLYQNRGSFEGGTSFADGSAVDMDDLVLPFVSFEGETRVFATDPDYAVPLLLRGTTLNEDLEDPYTRQNNGNATKLDAMVSKKLADFGYNSRYTNVINSNDLREYLAQKIGLIQSASGILPTVSELADQATLGLPNGSTRMSYPNNNRYSDRIQAAVTLAIENSSSMYITVGGGLGGWDDHNNGIDNYPDRMSQLFDALKSAALHIKYSGTQTAGVAGTPGGGVNRRTDNIVINVFGDFGRRVNLNNSEGWDHGNNQNLYTIGGAGVVSAANGGANRQLGKVVGRTERVGDPGTNNQVTEPQAGSYEIEPMSVAASVYSYFGVQNPEILTADPDRNPAGDAAIDETVAGEPALF
ncbi:MAG: twin-arginine translocation signal domain-containing protein [Gammaproteobacteria bacterium]|nr:twin-arginine translocation signal domain-containing protein [Gammaproteobacteria bacterium]